MVLGDARGDDYFETFDVLVLFWEVMLELKKKSVKTEKADLQKSYNIQHIIDNYCSSYSAYYLKKQILMVYLGSL